MKKIYDKLHTFLCRFFAVGVLLTVALFLISCIALLFSHVQIIAGVSFGFSLVALFRLMTYKTGKIPLFMHDKTWNAYQMKYSQEEAEEKYKQMSIKRATAYFMIAVMGFVVMIACELLFLV